MKKLLNIILTFMLAITILPLMTKTLNALDATEWKIGNTINLNGAYVVAEDKTISSGDKDVTVPNPIYNTNFDRWEFEDVFDGNDLYLVPPISKTPIDTDDPTEEETPIGFKISGGDGSQDNPYTFELVYDMSIKEVTLTVTPPEVGSSGSVEPAVSGGRQFGGTYYISDTSWCDSTGTATTIETFVADNDYYALISLTASEGYYWNQIEGQGVATNVNGATLISAEYTNSTEGCYATIVVKLTPGKAKEKIENVDLIVGIPKAGEEVSMEKDPSDPESYLMYTQYPIPNINVENCHIYEERVNRETKRKIAFWISDDQELFVGKFEDGKKYIIKAFIEPDDGYTFASKEKLTVTATPASNVKVISFNIGEEFYTKRKIMNLELEVIPEKEDKYYVSKGDGQSWQKGSSSGLNFTFDRSVEGTVFENKDHIEVDGNKVDLANYTEKEGSWVVELKASYLESLSVGEHTIEAKFVDYTGPAATAKFTVTEKKDSSSSSSTPYRLPKTGVE